MLKEDVLNIEIRKFLKKVGINSQREIEKSVRKAGDNSIVETNEALSAFVVSLLPPHVKAAPAAPKSCVTWKNIISNDTFIFHLVVGPVSGVIGSITLLPSLSLGVRRLHDVNRSGWWILLNFSIFFTILSPALLLFSIIGISTLIYFYCLQGDNHTNDYGNQQS